MASLRIVWEGDMCAPLFHSLILLLPLCVVGLGKMMMDDIVLDLLTDWLCAYKTQYNRTYLNVNPIIKYDIIMCVRLGNSGHGTP
ncbi:hypothetical protein GGS20DRAFT_550090, partial [Poronia punctata]